MVFYKWEKGVVADQKSPPFFNTLTHIILQLLSASAATLPTEKVWVLKLFSKKVWVKVWEDRERQSDRNGK